MCFWVRSLVSERFNTQSLAERDSALVANPRGLRVPELGTRPRSKERSLCPTRLALQRVRT